MYSASQDYSATIGSVFEHREIGVTSNIKIYPTVELLIVFIFAPIRIDKTEQIEFSSRIYCGKENSAANKTFDIG